VATSTSQAEALGPAITALRPRQIGALPLVTPILAALEVRSTINAVVPSQAAIDLGQLVVLLALNRLLAPQPLYRVADWLAQTVLPEVLGVAPAQVYDMRLGRALDRLWPHLGALWARLAARAIRVYDLDLSALHWDLTSLYFEGAYAGSALVAYGYSRDHRPDTKQVNLEVDVTHGDGVPIGYQVLPGQTADITRPVPHLRALLRFLARPELADRHLRPILVSDCKMVTAEAVLACHRHRLFYLGPLPNGTATEGVLRSVPAEELAAHPLAYRPQRVQPDDPRFRAYQGVWRPFPFVHGGQQVTDRALVVWSAGKQRLDERKRTTYLKRLLNGLAAIQKKLNTRRYKQHAYVEQRLATVQRGNPAHALVDVALAGDDGALHLTFRINREQLAAVQALDGRYALATNARHLAADAALALFKGQDGVEKRFRTVKGPLQVHPLFVRTDRRIEGLVFVTMLAVLVRAILERTCRQQGMAVTAERLFDAFATLQAVEVTWADGSRQRRVAELTPTQAQVLRTLDWPAPAATLALAPAALPP
jgi:transposase